MFADSEMGQRSRLRISDFPRNLRQKISPESAVWTSFTESPRTEAIYELQETVRTYTLAFTLHIVNTIMFFSYFSRGSEVSCYLIRLEYNAGESVSSPIWPQSIRILLGENFPEIVSFPTSSFTFGSDTDFGAFLSA